MIDIVLIYLAIMVGFWFILAFVSGFIDTKFGVEQFKDGLFWPITVFSLLGLIVRVITMKITNDKEENQE